MQFPAGTVIVHCWMKSTRRPTWISRTVSRKYWEENVSSDVMLTDITERDLCKCRRRCILGGRQWFMRSSLIHSLPDEVINRTVMQFGDTPIGCSKPVSSHNPVTWCSLNYLIHAAWIFELSGGAIADFEDTCLPKEQREAVWTVAALHQWEMGVDDPRCITSAEEVGLHLFYTHTWSRLWWRHSS